LVLAGGTIFLLANLDTSFKSVDEIEATLGIKFWRRFRSMSHEEQKSAGGRRIGFAAFAGRSLPAASEAYRLASLADVG